MKNSYIVLRVALAMFLLVSTLDIAFPPLSAPGVTPGRRTLIDRVIHGSPIAMFGMGEDTSGDALRVDAASVFLVPNTAQGPGSPVLVTCGIANVKGSWAEMVSSTGAQTINLGVYISDIIAASPYRMDVGTGTAGNEVPIISDMPMSLASDVGNVTVWTTFPMDIAASTRISMRCASDDGAVTYRASLISYQRR